MGAGFLMAIPDDQLETFLRVVANGDADAYDYLKIMAAAVYFADDIVDEPPDEIDTQELMAKLLWAAFVELPTNRFHQRWGAQLAPLLANAIVGWQKSDQWRQRKAPGYARCVFGFVWRENMDGLVTAVAAITGGRAHAMTVSELIMDVCHADGETVEDWLGEQHELRVGTADLDI
jgi:hypothetical protein